MASENDVLTTEERAEWTAIGEAKDSAEAILRELKGRQEALVAAAILRVMQADKWRAVVRSDDNVMLQPESSETSARLSRLLMEALSLGWHDRFLVVTASESVFVEAYVDDGALTLFIYGFARDFNEHLPRLELDIDVTEWKKHVFAEAIERADAEVEDAIAKRDALVASAKAP